MSKNCLPCRSIQVHQQFLLLVSCCSIFSFLCIFFFVYHCLPFLAHLAKGNVSFCHHLASVVCRLNFSHQVSDAGSCEPLVLLNMVLSVFRLMAFDYLFGIFKLFLSPSEQFLGHLGKRYVSFCHQMVLTSSEQSLSCLDKCHESFAIKVVLNSGEQSRSNNQPLVFFQQIMSLSLDFHF